MADIADGDCCFAADPSSLSITPKEERVTVASGDQVAIIHAQEEIFFGQDARGELRQWLTVTIDNPSGVVQAAATHVEAAGKRVETQLELIPGVGGYRCYAPVLWPEHAPVGAASLVLTVGDSKVYTAVSVGAYRPWTIYLLSDICTDYTWVFDQEELARAYDATVTKAELDLADAWQQGVEANRNHYNFVHAREAEFFLEHYPEEDTRFFDHIRNGTITLNPFYNMAATGNMSLEELIRQFYPARKWAMAQALDIGYGNHQETPTISWVMASILAGCGIDHLVKSILPYECPWATRLEEPPIFEWEGPDGKRVRVRRRNTDYVEGNFVLRDLRVTNMAVHDRILPEYQQLEETYPFNAIALVGCYGDLAPESAVLPSRKVETITAYNDQGWEYPKLVNASHRQFWDDIDHQAESRSISLPVYRGDYGTAWEAWAMSLAYEFAGWRRAQERAGAADKIAAILSRLDPAWYAEVRIRLEEGWMNLIYLADHAWNGSNDANRRLNAALRRRWQETANRAFDEVIAQGLKTLARHVQSPQANCMLVFNSLPWTRTALVRLPDVLPNTRVRDVTTGKAVPVQTVYEESGHVVYALVEGVPSVGYAILALDTDFEKEQSAIPFRHGDNWLEGPFYHLEVDADTGAICRLTDKIRNRELVDEESAYSLNQCAYLCDGLAGNTGGAEYGPRLAAVEIGAVGPLFAQMVVRSRLRNIQLTTTITLYAHLDRVDIQNDIEKVATGEREELAFVFPFNVPNRQYRIEMPGAIVTPAEDQLPGAGQAISAVRHFVDVYNNDYGVTLTMADSGLVEFGHRTSMEDPQAPDSDNSTVLAIALGNWINWREVTRDQAGQTDFTFRYSLCGHEAGFDPVRALRFSWQDNNELQATPVPEVTNGTLPDDRHAFVSVYPDHVVLSCMKPGEENGLVARAWAFGKNEEMVRLNFAGLGAPVTAQTTDLLERDQQDLALNGSSVELPVRSYSLATCRLRFAP